MPGRGSRAGKRPQRRNRTLALCRIGAETGGAALTSSLARVAVGAEAAGRPRFTARVGIGAEARGSTNTRALVAIGAEAAGGFSANLTYPNGCKNRIRVSIPAERIEATTTGFLAYFDETYTALRHTSLGGLVESVFGFDQRWELLDGTRLAYRRVLWDATTGRHTARILLPSVTAGQPVDLYLYFGKSVATDDQQPTAAYAGYALALNTRSGEDLTGQGRDFFATAVALPAGWESFTPLNVGTGGTHVLRNDTDYLIRNQTLTQSLRLQGGRRVVVMGLTITITRADWTTVGSSVTCGLFLEEGVTGGAPQANRAFYCEGIRMGGPNLTQGVLTYCPTADVYLSNIHVAGIRFDSCDHRDGTNGKTLNHPDLVQTTGSQKSLTIDGFTGYSAYQGLFFKEEENPQGGPIFLRRVDVRAIEHVGSDGISYPGNRMLWNESDQPLTIERGSVWVDGLPRNGHQDGGFYRERFFNGSIYVLDPAPSLAAERDAVLPRPTVGGTDARGAFAYFAIDTAPEINGVVYLGTPPFEFVPSASVGVGYDPAAARAPVTAGSLIGEAGSFDGTTSRLERAGLTALDGLPAVTIEAWVNASSIGHSGPIFAGGPSTAANDGALGVVLRFDKLGNDTSAANVVAFKVQAADGTTRFESAANTQAVGPTYIAGLYQPGSAPQVWLNDAFLAQANTPQPRSGLANLVRSGSAWVGFSPITDTDEAVVTPVSGLRINPFTKSCGYHRPIGIGRAGARADDVSTPDAWKNYYGIPKGFFTAGTGSPADTPAVPGSRGRLSTIRSFRIEGGAKFSKYSLENDTSWTVFEVRDQNATGTVLVNQGFPEAFKSIFAITRRADGTIVASDNVISIYYPATDVCRLFFSLDWDPLFGPNGSFLCGFVRTFSLKGVGHVAVTRTDTQDAGSSATRIRQPPGWILREEDCRLLRPMRYVIHATATRRSNNTSQLTANHILGRSRIWPAAGVDSNAGDDTGSGGLPNNQGDIPYGTLLTIRRMDWGLRDSTSLGLTSLGKLLFDQLRFYGLRVMDGNTVFIGSGATQGSCLQVRISGGPASNGYLWANTLRDQVNAEYAKMTELLWPVMNTRDYGAETELHTDGFWYSAGGGPVDGKALALTECINTAFNA
jgi:hypothetical protein